MQTRQVIIRRFAIGPLAQWGFVAGLLIACLPAFVCSWALFAVVNAARNLIVGWSDVGVDLLGQRLSVNLVEVLSLQDLLGKLNGVAGLGVFGILLVALLLAGMLGVFGAIVLTLLGMFYNTTGRVRLELQEVEPGGQSASDAVLPASGMGGTA